MASKGLFTGEEFIGQTESDEMFRRYSLKIPENPWSRANTQFFINETEPVGAVRETFEDTPESEHREDVLIGRWKYDEGKKIYLRSGMEGRGLVAVRDCSNWECWQASIRPDTECGAFFGNLRTPLGAFPNLTTLEQDLPDIRRLVEAVETYYHAPS